jgi:8-oxo-dGTP pyrophosphatase MutT (NUDIX family)/broad specificity phosphatase PhoE
MSGGSHVVEAAGGIVYRWTADPSAIQTKSDTTQFSVDYQTGIDRVGSADTALIATGNGANRSSGKSETGTTVKGRHLKRETVPAITGDVAVRAPGKHADKSSQADRQTGTDHRSASKIGSSTATQSSGKSDEKSGKSAKHRARHAKRERHDFAGLEVCLVHRPKYDDWSWPKGKNKENESSRHTAVREIEEECGLPVALGVRIGEVEYPLDAEGSNSKHRNSGSSYLKHVTYWMATPIPSDESERRQTAVGPINPASPNEVDEVVWLPIPAARKKLTHPLDREILDQFVDLAKQGAIAAHALIIVRHSKAEARKRWQGSDDIRPITPRGAAASFALMRELGCYSPTRIVSSPWLRCMESILQYAWHAQLPIYTAPALTEDAFAANPDGAWTLLMNEIDGLFTDGTYLEQARDDNPQRHGSISAMSIREIHPDVATPTALTSGQSPASDSKQHSASSETGTAETKPEYNGTPSAPATHTTLVSMHRPVIGGMFEHLRAMCVSKPLAKQLISKTPYMVTGSAVALFVVNTPEGRRIIDIQKVTPFVY